MARPPQGACGARFGLAAFTKPVFPLAPDVSWLIAARFVDRVGKGIRGAPRDALVADLTPPEIRGASFGLRQSLDTIGAFLGPSIAIVLMLITADRFTTVFWIALIPAFLAIALIVFAVHGPDHPAAQRQVRSPLSRAELAHLGDRYWWVVGIAAIFTLARFSEAFLVLRAQAVGLPIALVPTVMVLMIVVYALAAYPAGTLSDHMSRRTLLIVGVAVLVAADIVLAEAGRVAGVAVGVALWGLHIGLTQGLLATLIADTASAELRGTAFGMFNLVTGVVLLAASVIAGELWDVIGPEATFLGGAAFAVLAIVGVAALPLDHLAKPRP